MYDRFCRIRDFYLGMITVEDLIACSKGEIDHLEIIDSVEPWSEERIRRDTDRIVNNPTRLEKIRAFSLFVNSESHALLKFASYSGFTIQQAYNSARSGLVAHAAESIVNAKTDEAEGTSASFIYPDGKSSVIVLCDPGKIFCVHKSHISIPVQSH